MPDIRQTTSVRDDFNRTENPLSQGGNWTKPGVTAYYLQAEGSVCVWVTSGHSGHALYQSITMDGDSCEVWCSRYAGNAAGLAWGIGFYDGTGANANGWLFRSETDTGGGHMKLYKLTNGSFTGVVDNGSSSGISSPGGMLIRRVGNDIEGWVEDGGSTYDSGTMVNSITHTDAAYQTGMYPVLELFGGGGPSPIHGWDNFGAGAAPPNRQQFFRRPLG